MPRIGYPFELTNAPQGVSRTPGAPYNESSLQAGLFRGRTLAKIGDDLSRESAERARQQEDLGRQAEYLAIRTQLDEFEASVRDPKDGVFAKSGADVIGATKGVEQAFDERAKQILAGIGDEKLKVGAMELMQQRRTGLLNQVSTHERTEFAGVQAGKAEAAVGSAVNRIATTTDPTAWAGEMRLIDAATDTALRLKGVLPSGDTKPAYDAAMNASRVTAHKAAIGSLVAADRQVDALAYAEQNKDALGASYPKLREALSAGADKQRAIRWALDADASGMSEAEGRRKIMEQASAIGADPTTALAEFSSLRAARKRDEADARADALDPAHTFMVQRITAGKPVNSIMELPKDVRTPLQTRNPDLFLALSKQIDADREARKAVAAAAESRAYTREARQFQAEERERKRVEDAQRASGLQFIYDRHLLEPGYDQDWNRVLRDARANVASGAMDYGTYQDISKLASASDKSNRAAAEFGTAHNIATGLAAGTKADPKSSPQAFAEFELRLRADLTAMAERGERIDSEAIARAARKNLREVQYLSDPDAEPGGLKRWLATKSVPMFRMTDEQLGNIVVPDNVVVPAGEAAKMRKAGIPEADMRRQYYLRELEKAQPK